MLRTPRWRRPKRVSSTASISPWSPPEPVILAMSSQHPSLLFRLEFEEETCAFAGEATLQGGKVLEFVERGCEEEEV